MNNRGRIFNALCYRPTLVGALVVVFLLPGVGAAESKATDGGVFEAADLSSIVRAECGELRPADAPGRGEPDAWKTYAECAVSSTSENSVFQPILASCPEPLSLTLAPRSPEGPHATRMLVCMLERIVEAGLGPQFSALGEACLLLEDDASGCTLQDHCEGCPDIHVARILQINCNETTDICTYDLVEVKHLSTQLVGECAGELTTPYDGPGRRYGNWTYDGSYELFEWNRAKALPVEESVAWNHMCLGEAQIDVEGQGGFHRLVVMTDEHYFKPLCDYDGFIEPGCTGSIKKDREVQGTVGAYNAARSEGSRPTATMTFEHEAGWVLLNVGEGSTRAIAVLNPDPVDVPAKTILVDVDYNVTHTNEPPEPGAKSTPAPHAILIAVLVIGSLVAVRPRHTP